MDDKKFLSLLGLEKVLEKLKGIFASASQGDKADEAYQHASSAHAPSNAERNVIVGVQENGKDLTPNSSTRKVNVTVPTKTSELTNDSGYKTTDTNTTYTLSKSGSTITLKGSDGSETSVEDENNSYSLSSFGVTATADELNKLDGVTATAKEINYVDGVTSNIQTQLNGKAASSHTHDDRYYTENEVDDLLTAKANATHNHNASNINTGTLAVDRLPSIPDSKITGMSATKLSGIIPQANLPSYVDDVIEYNGKSNFPEAGETGKIYVDTSTNKTYRWSGTSYVEISSSLALGTTSSTAFRGDYGNTAYQHATAKGSAFSSGLYKIATNAQGHVTSATAVTKSDITALGIPAQDTNTTYTNATTSKDGLMSQEDKTKLDGIATGANKYTHPSYTAKSSGLYKVAVDATGHVSATSAVTKGDITALGIPASDTNTWIAFKGATSSAAGTAGYAPAPSAGAANRYLRSDGTWAVPPDTNTTYGSMGGASTSAAGKTGLVPAPSAGAANRYLRSDGTWAVPPDTNTTYTLGSFGITATAAELNKLDGVTASAAEINFLDGVTSNIQSQLNGKASASHGTHVSYGTSAPLAPGTASAGSASTVSRSDHRHPLQTSVSGSSGSCTGNAATASKLATSRTISLSGDASGSASFNGSANATISATVLHHSHTNIPSKANLNSYTDPGWYYCPANATATTLTNCPTENAFALIVVAHAGVSQTLIEYMASAFHIWTRNQYDGSWGSWAEIYTTIQKPTASEIGAAAASHTHSGYAASSHNHSAANITSGTLAVARGGTGLAASPSMLTNLGSTSAASVFTASPRPGITGTLPIAHGGTGATTASAARSALGAAASSHNHAASNITSGTLPVARGGTGGTTAATARTGIGAINTVCQKTEPTTQNTGDFWFREV